MKRNFLILILFVLFITQPVFAEWLEGEVIEVNSTDCSLVLQTLDGNYCLKLAESADLYYNNLEADLGMYAPVTENDYVSGSLLTNDEGLVEEAYFYYLVREGTISTLNNSDIVLLETGSGILDTYELADLVQIYFNNTEASLSAIRSGMKALLILDHKFQVKKIAVFHYDYTGIIEEIDLDKKTLLVNIGSRLEPVFKRFTFDQNVTGIQKSWEHINEIIDASTFVIGKLIVSDQKNLITYLEVCSF